MIPFKKDTNKHCFLFNLFKWVFNKRQSCSCFFSYQPVVSTSSVTPALISVLVTVCFAECLTHLKHLKNI